jgi:uncharacterized protein with HEPN domain
MHGKAGDKARLKHIQQAIAYIEEFIENKSRKDLDNDPKLRFAIERQFEIIGEASNHLSEELRNKAHNIDWRAVVGFRNFIVH